MLSKIKRLMVSNVLSNRYDFAIRVSVILICFGIGINSKGDCLTFKHFDSESGISCLLSGVASDPTLSCHSDNVIGVKLSKVSPVGKTWHYKMKDGYINILRQGYSKGIEFIATSNRFKGGKVFDMPYKNN